MKLIRNGKKYRTVIKVDLDKKKLPDFTIQSLYYIAKYYHITKLIIKKSQSGNLHLKLYLLNEIEDSEIIMLQLLLGSDKVRERLNFLRMKNGAKMKDWNILFDRKIDEPLLNHIFQDDFK